MSDCWLKSNRRAVWPSLIASGLLSLAGGAGWVVAWWCNAWWLLQAMAALVTLVPAAAAAALAYWSRLPRLAFGDGQLLVFLEGTRPQQVPAEHVECFFRGQAEAAFPGGGGHEGRTATIVVRLAEAATPWHQRDVRPALGSWCGGYITIRGTWCEPITPELLRDLNSRLVAVHRAQRNAAVEVTNDASAGQRA